MFTQTHSAIPSKSAFTCRLLSELKFGKTYWTKMPWYNRKKRIKIMTRCKKNNFKDHLYVCIKDNVGA